MRPGRRVVVCQQWTEMVTDYLEGALPKGLARAIDRHLADCVHCVEYLAQMRRTIAITRLVRVDHVPDEMIGVLQRAFEEHHRAGA